MAIVSCVGSPLHESSAGTCSGDASNVASMVGQPCGPCEDGKLECVSGSGLTCVGASRASACSCVTVDCLLEGPPPAGSVPFPSDAGVEAVYTGSPPLAVPGPTPPVDTSPAASGDGSSDQAVADEADEASATEAADESDAAAGADTSSGCPGPVSTGTSAVAYQIDSAHDGWQATDTLTLPLCQRWQVTFTGPVSYPLIAAGRVFVTTPFAGGLDVLYALDEHTGVQLWGPLSLAGSAPTATATYDAGRVFTVNYDGVVTAFDAESGATDWTVVLGQSGMSPPTAFQGTIYVEGGGLLYAVDEASGTTVWTADVPSGAGTPAVSASGVYASYTCNDAYSFDPATGAILWNAIGSCSGGGGLTAALFADYLYTRDVTAGNLILNALTGAKVGTYAATPIPAFAGLLVGQETFRVTAGALGAFAPAGTTSLWSVADGGSFVTAPIVVGSDVVVATENGGLAVLDGNTGQLISSTNITSAISIPNEVDATGPLTGLAEADGILVVPAGSTLVAY